MCVPMYLILTVVVCSIVNDLDLIIRTVKIISFNDHFYC